jgi:hypothetical protein
MIGQLIEWGIPVINPTYDPNVPTEIWDILRPWNLFNPHLPIFSLSFHFQQRRQILWGVVGMYFWSATGDFASRARRRWRCNVCTEIMSEAWLRLVAPAESWVDLGTLQ